MIVWVFQIALKGLLFLTRAVEKGTLTFPGFSPDWAAPTYQLVRVIVYALMLVVIFANLPGSDSPAFKGVTVFLGLVFSGGSSGSLSNFVAGPVLTYMRAFRVGDRGRIGTSPETSSNARCLAPGFGASRTSSSASRTAR